MIECCLWSSDNATPTWWCFPELWPNGGFTYDLWRPTAQPMSGALVARLRESAAGLGCVVHAGSFVELHEDGSLTNTSLLLDGNGETLAVYRKIHLFGFGGGEPALMSVGCGRRGGGHRAGAGRTDDVL